MMKRGRRMWSKVERELARVVTGLSDGSHEQRGVACMEFIFVLPILFCIFIVAVEFAQFIRVRQAALVLSREAALRASRQCGGIVSFREGALNEALTKTRTITCLQRVRQAIEQEASFSLTGTSFAFSALKRLPGVADPVSVTEGTDTHELAVSGNDITWNGRVVMQTAQFNLHQHITLVEMRYNYTPMIAGPLAIIGLGPIFRQESQYREITIF